MAATIKIYKVDGTLRYTALAEEDSKRVFSLMEDDYIELVFKTRQELNFELGDYIEHETYGKFELTTIQKPDYNTDTAAYEYSLQFDALYVKWQNKKYKFDPSANRYETSFSLTAKVDSHMEVLLKNLSYHGFTFNGEAYTWAHTWTDEPTEDEEDDTVYTSQYITFDSVSIYEALDKIAEAFDVEWWVIDNCIYLGRADNGNTAVEFEMGKNVADMEANDSEGDDYFNAFIAFGSDKNLPYNYRNSTDESGVITYGVTESRLMLPTTNPVIYLDGVDEDTPEEQIVEGVVVFDDIYPKTNGVISEVTSFVEQVEVEDDTTVDETTYEDVTFYRFRDANLVFDEDYILSGETLQITFSTGNLAGMTFDVEFNPLGVSKDSEDYQMFEIVRNNNYGIYLPAENYAPAVDDEYSLIGFDATAMTDLGLVDDAEAELLKRAKQYAKKLEIDPYNYDCTMMADYMYGRNESGELDSDYAKTFGLGDVILLKNTSLFGSDGRQSRVIGYEYRLDEPFNNAKITVGENTTYSRSSALEGEIDAKFSELAYGTSESSVRSGGNNIYIITSNDTTAESNSNVYSALRTKNSFVRKNVDDTINALWTLKQSLDRKGIQTNHYTDNTGNEDNTFGKGFALVYENGVSKLEVDKLLVRMKATFASLEIRQMCYVGGNFVFSSAGSKIYHVVECGSYYRCYLYSDDGTTATENNWEEGDQALCQTFDIDETAHTDTSNKYYWRLVIGVGKEQISGKTKYDEDGNEVEDDTKYQYVDISVTDCSTDTTDIPAADDTIVQFGSQTDTARQGVIYIMVTGDIAPALLEYSGINSFNIPEPSTQISPTGGNIFKGKFYSIADGTTNNSTIQEQITSLLSDYEDIRKQADDKMEVWFNSGAPTPTEDDLETYNAPAEDWTTDTLKESHVGDLYYDTDKDPASDGGRAWKWHYDGTNYYWQEVTDQDTISALEKAAALQKQVDDIVDDGIISGGSEKSELLKEWNEAASLYITYNSFAEERSLKELTVWTEYEDSLIAVASMLDNELASTSPFQTSQILNGEIPEWINGDALQEDTVLSETMTQDAATYRSIWATYYDKLAAWASYTSDLALDKTDELQTQITSIVSDNIISGGTEKGQLLLEWQEALAGYTIYKGQAEEYSLTNEPMWTEYVDCLLAVATMLNNDTEITEETISNDLAWFADMSADTDLSETSATDANGYRTVWKNYYTALADFTSYLSQIALDKANDAMDAVNQIADDGVITSSEKSDLLEKWQEVIATYQGYLAEVSLRELSEKDEWTAYVATINSLGTLLNGGTAWTIDTIGTLPSWINDLTTDTEITDVDGYRTAWTNYYTSLAEWIAYLSETAHQRADDLQDEIDNIVSDGIISGGDEKRQLLTEWQTAVSKYNAYKELYESREDLDADLWGEYTASLYHVGLMLNGDDPNGDTYGMATPSWITDANLSVDTVLSEQTYVTTANAYSSFWLEYYDCLAQWEKYLSALAYTKSDSLQSQINDIVSDGVIKAGAEKSQLLIDWQEALSNYNLYKDQTDTQTAVGGTLWTDYQTAFFALGKMLNNGVEYTDTDTLPTWIGTDYDNDITITDVAAYRTTWNTYKTEYSEWLQAVSDKALEKATNAESEVNKIVDDGIISKGTEKSQLLREWQEALSSYLVYSAQVDTTDENLPSEWTSYYNAFFALATVLNDGTAYTDTDTTPSWIGTEYENDTTLSDVGAYQTAWKTYYTAFAAWTSYLSETALSEAEDLQSQIDNITSDGVISKGTEKSNLLKEWQEAVANYTTYQAQATSRSLTSSDAWIAYEESLFRVGMMLNGEDPTGETVTFTSDNINDSLAWLDTETDTTLTITAETYRATWTTYYTCLAAWISYLSEVAYDKIDDVDETAQLSAKILALTQLAIAYNTSFGDYANNDNPPIIYINSSAETHVTTAGSIVYDGTQVLVNPDDGDNAWSNPVTLDSSNAVYLAIVAFYNTVGSAEISVYKTATTATEYDIAIRDVSYVDAFSGDILTAPNEILGYINGAWQVLQESVQGVIENLGNQLRLLVYGSDDPTTVTVSGLVTTEKFSTMFAQKITTDADTGYVTAIDESKVFSSSDFATLLAEKFTLDDSGNVVNTKAGGLVTTTSLTNTLLNYVTSSGLTQKLTSYLTSEVASNTYLTTEAFTGMFAAVIDDNTKIATVASLSAYVAKKVDDDGNTYTDEDGNTYLESGVMITADNIILEGVVTANSTFQIDTDGYMSCIGGTIGGFAISSSSLVASSGSTDDGDLVSMSLSKNLIHFQDTTCNAYLGSNTIPSTLGGIFSSAMRIDVERSGTLYGNAGLYLNITGSTAYDTVDAQYTGNHAMYIPNGDICGFRLRARRISSSQTLSVMDSVIFTTNTDTITLTLPTGAEDGQMYYIRKCSSGAVKVAVDSESGDQIRTNFATFEDLIDVDNGDLCILIYNASSSNPAWISNKIEYDA